MAGRDSKRADRGRWRLVGNAVSVPVAEWLATRLFDPASEEVEYEGSEIRAKHVAAFGGPAMPTRYIQGLGEGPASTHQSSVADFGLEGGAPLSRRAADGFLSRYMRSGLTKNMAFAAPLTSHCGLARKTTRLNTTH